MKKLKQLFSMLCLVFIAFTLTGCPDDNDDLDEGPQGSAFYINDEPYYVEYEGIEYGAHFYTRTNYYLVSVNLYNKDFYHYPDSYLLYFFLGEDDIQVGKTIEDFEFRDFRPINHLTNLEDFQGISGSVSVKSANSSMITLTFKNFKFKMNNGTYTLNGELACKKGDE